MILHFLLVFLHILGVFLAAWHFARHFSEALRAVSRPPNADPDFWRNETDERIKASVEKTNYIWTAVAKNTARINSLENRETEGETDLLTLAKEQGIMRDQPEPRD